jgi:hypothetical protein
MEQSCVDYTQSAYLGSIAVVPSCHAIHVLPRYFMTELTRRSPTSNRRVEPWRQVCSATDASHRTNQYTESIPNMIVYVDREQAKRKRYKRP